MRQESELSQLERRRSCSLVRPAVAALMWSLRTTVTRQSGCGCGLQQLGDVCEELVGSEGFGEEALPRKSPVLLHQVGGVARHKRHRQLRPHRLGHSLDIRPRSVGHEHVRDDQVQRRPASRIGAIAHGAQRRRGALHSVCFHREVPRTLQHHLHNAQNGWLVVDDQHTVWPLGGDEVGCRLAGGRGGRPLEKWRRLTRMLELLVRALQSGEEHPATSPFAHFGIHV
mmetsp:Transcript_6708/g.14821  ORF Transcript_6708/g.14821 Transcript_6708/m.14821 type:complete len:227 (+) Transcript_6708:1271-1951(+)